MRALAEITDFLARIRTRMRFGHYSRLQLRLLRFELKECNAECEWLARPNDPWDMDLPVQVREQNHTLQALRDALNMRETLFKSMPDVQTIRVRVYRQHESSLPELIITGSLSREDEPPPRLSSLAMQAKLAGLHFTLEDGYLLKSLGTAKTFEFVT